MILSDSLIIMLTAGVRLEKIFLNFFLTLPLCKPGYVPPVSVVNASSPILVMSVPLS